MCFNTNTPTIAEEDTPDIYGQVHPKETPQLIEASLVEFDTLVKGRVAANDKDDASLIEAIEKCPDQLTQDFKLGFLRCEVFAVDKAVARYSFYWKKRVSVFGQERAFLPLTLDGALSKDKVALEKGMVTWLKGAQDPMGRAIFYVDYSVQDKTYERLSMVRSIFYVFHVALTEMETAQKHGVVVLLDPSQAKFSQWDRGLSKASAGCARGAWPIRISALHLCNPPACIGIILPIVKLLLPARISKRIKFHNGDLEGLNSVASSLAKYGLKEANVPTQLGGDFQINHPGWLASQREKGC